MLTAFALLASRALAADIVVLDENFDAYSTGTFSGTTAWTSYYSADTWSAAWYSGVYAKTDDSTSTGTWGSGGAQDNHLVYTDDSWADATFEFQLYQGDDDAIGASFRFTDAKNFYLFMACGPVSGTAASACPAAAAGTDTTLGAGFYLYSVVSGAGTLVASTTSVTLTPEELLSVKIVTSGHDIDIYVDLDDDGSYGSGEHLFDLSSSVHSDGMVGFYCYNDGDGNGGCYFDDAVVSVPDTDNDGLADESDNCPTVSNASQDDADGDGVGDVCDTDADGDGYAAGSSTSDDCDDTDDTIHPGATELCSNKVDDNCNGSSNDVGSSGCANFYYDSDKDTYGTTAKLCMCTAAGTYTASNDDDCDDADSSDNPAGVEVCNGDDEDCDGVADDGATDQGTYYIDDDGDGYGDAATSVESCTAPAGYAANADDCDDADPAIYAGADEHCDGLDEDCDGAVDDNATDALTTYADADGDSFGDADALRLACEIPAGYVSDDSDCDDANAAINPAGTERCNGHDDDCDGRIDLDAVDATPWYSDADGDTWGDDSTLETSCDPIPGRVDTAGDCDDLDPDVNPGAPEVCDDLDQDCDNLVDEDAVDAFTFYADTDGDGHGDPGEILRLCDPADGSVANDTDCDDTDASVYQGAPEIADELDNDCNGLADDVVDSDGDGLDDYTERETVGSDPFLADTDGDGLDDGDEVSRGTSPLLPDTDGGGTSDGAEVLVDHTNPLDPADDVQTDTDEDGLTDAEESVLGTDPDNPDTDGGGLGDGDEVDAGKNPLDPTDDLEDTGQPGLETDRLGGLYGGGCGAAPGLGLGLVLSAFIATRKRRV